MPSPLAHGLAAVALAGFAQHFPRRTGALLPPGNRPRLLLVVAALACAACAPDFDFVPGVLVGDPDWLHRGRSHSLLAAAVFGMVAYGIGRLTRTRGAAPFALLMGLAYASHVFLDMFSPDPVRFNGVPAFWPLSTSHFVLPASVFLPIRRDPAAGGFLASLWSLHNVYALLRETLIMGAVVTIGRLAIPPYSRFQPYDTARRSRLDRRVDSES